MAMLRSCCITAISHPEAIGMPIMPRMLNFLIALRRLPPLSALSGDEERLLFELRHLWSEQGQLSVSDVYDLAAGKSASTAYRQLMSLRDKGFVDISVTSEDKRKREVTFTNTAENLFNSLAKL
jgi:DNA-binding transcriptional ArsR family regulator